MLFCLRPSGVLRIVRVPVLPGWRMPLKPFMILSFSALLSSHFCQDTPIRVCLKFVDIWFWVSANQDFSCAHKSVKILTFNHTRIL